MRHKEDLSTIPSCCALGGLIVACSEKPEDAGDHPLEVGVGLGHLHAPVGIETADPVSLLRG